MSEHIDRGSDAGRSGVAREPRREPAFVVPDVPYHALLDLSAANEMIKHKGFAVSPTELEGLLHQHPAVEDCAVVGQPSPDGDESPCAYLVLRDPRLAGEAVEHVNRQVATYKQIRDVRVVASIPRNDAGKVLKRLLA